MRIQIPVLGRMDEEMRRKYEEVRIWLEQVFGDETIPNFEVTEETVTHLHSLSLHNRKMNHLSTLLLNDLKTKCREYQQENNRMKEILDGVGLPVFALSNPGKSSLKMLGQLASELNIKDVKKSSYLLALNDLTTSKEALNDRLSSTRADQENELRQVESSVKGLEAVATHYKKLAECSAVDVPLAEKKKKEIAKMEAKTATYRRQVLEEEQTHNAVSTLDKHVHHQYLLRLSEQLKGLQEELKPLEVKYQGYKSLPPDLNMAKVKIEETKREMKRLEKELEGDIEYYATL